MIKISWKVMERFDLYKPTSKNGTKFWCELSIGSTECSNIYHFDGRYLQMPA